MHKKEDIKTEAVSWAVVLLIFISVLLISREKMRVALQEAGNPGTASGSPASRLEAEELLVDAEEEPDAFALQDFSGADPYTSFIGGVEQELPGQASVPLEAPPATVSVATKNSRDAKLYFMMINGDGSINRREVVRSLPQTGGPLRATIEALLEGPTAEERAKGCRTLIAEGTRLIGASVRDGVATLNFSEEFEYNTLGVQGLIGELEQIVYTATEFSTVNSVQFLVDSQQKEYLGAEGVWIGSPLSRTKF